MATVTSSSIILQSITTLGGGTTTYPSSGNGFTTVTVNYGDTVVVPLRSGSTGTAAGTSNYGNTPNGNTGTGGTFVSPSTSFSSSNPTINVTISNIQYDGLISFWCGPSDGGSSVGWRGRVQVIVNKVSSYNLDKTVETINETATSYTNGLTSGGAGTIYYVLNVNNYPDGSNINSLFTGSDSRYIARTFTTSSTKPFSTDGVTATITNDLPTTGTFDTYYIYGANLLGQESEYFGDSYTVGRADTSITLTPSATTITAASTADVTVNVTGDTSGTQYRLYTNNINRWVSTYNGGGSSTTDFLISYDEDPSGAVNGVEGAGTGVTELPGTGQTFTYFSQARVITQNAGWINTGDSFTITRSAAATYSVSASPTSINEGQSTTYTVTYSNVDSARTVNYTIGGINSSDLSSGSLTGSFSISSGSGTATTSITLQNDVATEGTETATLTLASTDSTGASTGTPSASVTVADTSNQGGSSGGSGSIGGGATETYGLSITNIAGTSVIINNNSRLGTFLNSASITINNNNQSGQLFTNSGNGGAINCSDNTIIGMHTTWTGSAWLHPVVTRNASTGITVTRLNFGGSDPTNIWAGTLTISLIRY